MRSKIISGIVLIINGLLLAIGPYMIFPVCKGKMMTMPCQNTAKAELVTGCLVLVLGVLSLIIKNRRNKILLYTSVIIIGLLALLLPNALTGVCSQIHMTCRSLTLPALSIISLALIAIAGLNVFTLCKTESKGEITDGTGPDH